MTYQAVSELPVIDRSDLKQMEDVAKGEFGTLLYKAKFNGKVVAVKEYQSPNNISQFEAEFNNLANVQHPNIIEIFARSSAEQRLIVTEYSEICGLDEVIDNYTAYNYETAHGVSWARQAADGLAHLHKLNLMHRDVKPANMRLFEKGNLLKLANFGLSCQKRPSMTLEIGTAAYMAPEVLKRNNYDEKCDVYSWSILFWQVLSRRTPFEGKLVYAVLFGSGKESGEDRLPLDDKWPMRIRSLIRECWDGDDEKRPGMEEVALRMTRLQELFSGKYQPVDFSAILQDAGTPDYESHAVSAIRRTTPGGDIEDDLGSLLGSIDSHFSDDDDEAIAVTKDELAIASHPITVAETTVPTSPHPLNISETMIVIEKNELYYLTSVGSGVFGIVYKAEWRGRIVAVKEPSVLSDNERRAFKREMQQLAKACHPNVVELLAISPKYCLLVMELSTIGAVISVIDNLPNCYSMGHGISWAYQAAEGVAYLHRNKTLHRDLKPANMLLFNDGILLKLADFGLSCAIRTTQTAEKGSPAYMAPEVWQGTDYDGKCDVYSWAISFWHILARTSPFKGKTTYQVMGEAIYKRGDRLPLDDTWPVKIHQIIRDCWNGDRSKRPDMAEVAQRMAEWMEVYPERNRPIDFKKHTENVQMESLLPIRREEKRAERRGSHSQTIGYHYDELKFYHKMALDKKAELERRLEERGNYLTTLKRTEHVNLKKALEFQNVSDENERLMETIRNMERTIQKQKSTTS